MTVFDHIIAGRLRASFVHQDEHCVAFMDIRPFSPGHVLVVPRVSVPTLAELDAASCAHLLQVGRRIAAAQQRALGSAAQHFIVNDGKAAAQTVPHVHLHVIPRYPGDRWRALSRMALHIALLGRPPREDPVLRGVLDEQAARIAAALLPG